MGAVFTSIIDHIHNFVWGIPMLVLLVGTHLYMTIRTKGIQRKLLTGIRLSVSQENRQAGDVSQFGALTTALAATIGTGNIIGVGTAIALGGPGAVFWMWITGILGIATKYAESLVSVKFRVRTHDGRMLGGAMYALDRGVRAKWLGVLFAFFAATAAFGIGASVQSNAISVALQENFHVPGYATAAVIAILLAVVIFGGVKSITRVCEHLVPFMAAGYVICCVGILICQRAFVLDAIELIVKSAFSPASFGGGVVGSGLVTAMRFGMARGLFSNESGMGSAPIVGAAAQTKNPCRQALVSMTGTFWDTVVVCLVTGVMITTSILAYPDIFTTQANGTFVIQDGGILTSQAFNTIPVAGGIILSVSIAIFAFSTILGWSYYGERAAEYLMGTRVIVPYRIIYIGVALLGALADLGLVWTVADILNALMAIPNLIAIWMLAKVIQKETNYYVYSGHLDEVDTTPIPTRNEDGSLPPSAYEVATFADGGTYPSGPGKVY